MVEIKFTEHQLEDGVLVFNSGGDDKTINVTITGYNQPYSLFVNVYNSDGKNMVASYEPVCEYEDDKDKYAIWKCRFVSQENVDTVPSRGYINFMYEESNGSIKEVELPYYVRYSGEGIIHPFVSTIVFNADGTPEKNGYDELSIGYSGVGIIEEPSVNADWVTVIDFAEKETGGYYEYVYGCTVVVQPNTGDTRTATITFILQDTVDVVKTETVTIKQNKLGVIEPDEPETPESNEEVTYAPFWQDTLYSFANGEEYGLYVEEIFRLGQQTFIVDKLIYSGKIYASPKQYRSDVAINRICQNYINDAVLDFNYVQLSDIYKFKLKVGDVLRHTYYFVRDWSYKPLTLGIKTNPIIPYIGTGQRLFFSAFATERKAFSYGIKYYNGEEDYTNGMSLTNELATEIIAESRTKGVEVFSFGDKEFKRLPLCKCKYVLYYLNPYGGWDWLPIIGRVTKRDNIEQYTYTKNYNNTKADFGKYRYLSEIHTTYTMHSGWLTQAQSDRMWELLESNCVYLHNLEEDKISSVILTHTEVEYKQKTNRSRMIDYEIRAEESQTKERI